MSALGSLVVSLSLEYAAYTKGLDKSSQESLKFARNTQKAFDNASSALGNMVKGVLAAGAAYLTLSKGIEAVNDSIDGLAALDDLSQKTGSSVESLSKMQKVAKQFGADFNSSIDPAISKLAKGMASVDSETNKAHKALAALNLTDFSKTHDASEVMVEAAKRLQGYADGAGKAALATDLFGKSGADLLPYLNDLAENYDSMTGASAKAAKQAADFQDKLGGLKLKVGELFQNLAIDLLPTLNDVAGAINDSINASRDMANDNSALNWADELALAGARVYDTFANVAALIKAVTGSFKVVYADLEVIGATAKLGNPGALAASIASGHNPYKDLATAKSARDKTLAEANMDWDASQNVDRSAAKNALMARFNLRELADFYGRGHRGTLGTGKADLDYESGSKPKENNSAAENAAKRLNDQRLKDIQDLIDAEREEFDAINQYKSKKEEEAAKEKAEMQKAWAEVERRNIDAAQKERDKAFEQEQRQLEKLADEQKQMAHEFSQALTNGLFDSFKKGESFGKAMLSNLLALAKTWAARLFDGLLSPIGSGIASIFTGGAASLFSGGASAATSGSSSIFSGLSSIGNLFSNGNAAIVSSIESLGTFLSTGTGGLGDMLGGALGQYAGAISNVLPFAGAAFSLLTGDIKGAVSQGIGAGIGLAIGGPIGGIIGSVAGSLLGGVFGGGHVSRPKYYANATVGGAGSKVIGAYGNSDASGTGGGVAINAGIAFGNRLNDYAKAFGASVKEFNLGVQYQQKYDSFLLTIGKPIGNGSGKDTYFKSADAELGVADAFLIAIRKGFIGLPDVLADIVKRSVTGNALNDLQSLSKINELFKGLKDLPPVFDAISYLLKNAKLSDAANLAASANAINTYTNLFYTQAEQFATYTKQLNTQFSALNALMPQSRDEFRALVDGIKVTDESTSNLFQGLVALAPAMDAYFKQLEAQKNVMADLLGMESFTSLAEYRAYKGVANNYGTTFAADFTANARSGAIGINASGQGNAGGNLDLVTLLKELRDIAKQTLSQTTDGTSLLQRFDRAGMPTRA